MNIILLVLLTLSPQKMRATATPHEVILYFAPPTVPAGSPAATSINVYRGTVSGGEGTTPYASPALTALPACPSGFSIPAGDDCYIDTGVTAGDPYFYEAAAVNSAGQGVLSNEVSVTIPNPQAPNAVVLSGVSQ